VRTTWSGDDAFTLDGVTYSSTVALDGAAHRAAMATGHLVIFKNRPLVQLYEDLIERHRPRSILELGICHGGGAALMAQLAEPDKLVALDFVQAPCEPLEEFIDDRGLRGSLVARYGVDQADTDALDEIMATEFDGPVDLVVDDASHLVEQTRASFNRLFPHVRPGGLYVIEDWSWAHLAGKAVTGAFRDAQPLSAFVVELVLAACRIPRAIAEVTVEKHWAVVRRGDAPLRPERFDVSAHFDPLAAAMVDRLAELRSPAGD
jgi:predicted O-methyltransferase YrrM